VRWLLWVAIVALPACMSAREREARNFVRWDAISDARQSADDQCDGIIELMGDLEGDNPLDYRCTLAPEGLGFQTT
jgi:hypothetical protein